MADVYKDPWARMYDKWEKYYLPPGRPSKGEISIYRDMIHRYSKKPGDALVLGATRELRNLLHEMDYKVTILDINPQALKQFNSLVPKWKEEKQVLGDWCDQILPEVSFDLIVGDVPVANVPLEKQPSFYTNVSRMLRDSGVFIHRTETVEEKDYTNDPTEIVETYAISPIPKDYRQHAFEFLCMLLARSVDRKTNLASVQVAIEFMKSAAEKHPKLKPLYDFNHDYWRDLDKKWVFETETLFLKRMSPYFILLERKCSEDNAMKDLWPIFSCKKRLNDK